MVCLPRALPPTAGPGRYVRLTFIRGPGPGFSERDRAVLTLLALHLDQAYLAVERRRPPAPPAPPPPPCKLCFFAFGAAGPPTPKSPPPPPTSEGPGPTHLENIYE